MNALPKPPAPVRVRLKRRRLLRSIAATLLALVLPWWLRAQATGGGPVAATPFLSWSDAGVGTTLDTPALPTIGILLAGALVLHVLAFALAPRGQATLVERSRARRHAASAALLTLAAALAYPALWILAPEHASAAGADAPGFPSLGILAAVAAAWEAYAFVREA